MTYLFFNKYLLTIIDNVILLEKRIGSLDKWKVIYKFE